MKIAFRRIGRWASVILIPVLLLSLLFYLHSCLRWRPIGQLGPWMGPGRRGFEVERSLFTVDLPRYENGYAGKWGIWGRVVGGDSVMRKLDRYFHNCKFIKQWPEDGIYASTQSYDSPYRLYLVSLHPMIIVGVKRTKPSAPWRDDIIRNCVVAYHIGGPIRVRTTFPYRLGSSVVWFSPRSDYILHRLSLKTGAAYFPIAGGGRITITVRQKQLVTERK